MGNITSYGRFSELQNKLLKLIIYPIILKSKIDPTKEKIYSTGEGFLLELYQEHIKTDGTNTKSCSSNSTLFILYSIIVKDNLELRSSYGLTDSSHYQWLVSQYDAIHKTSYNTSSNYKYYLDLLNINNKNIENIKKEYQTCDKPFFAIPINMIWGNMNQIHDNSHANTLIIGKNGSVIRIEPGNDPNDDDILSSFGNDSFNKTLLDFSYRIGVTNPKFVYINEQCPQQKLNQGITNPKDQDINCLFWSMYISAKILEGDFNTDPNEVIRDNFNKPNDVLKKDIIDFKLKLVNEVIPQGLERLGYTWPEYDKFIKEVNLKNMTAGSRKTKKNKLK